MVRLQCGRPLLHARPHVSRSGDGPRRRPRRQCHPSRKEPAHRCHGRGQARPRSRRTDPLPLPHPPPRRARRSLEPAQSRACHHRPRASARLRQSPRRQNPGRESPGRGHASRPPHRNPHRRPFPGHRCLPRCRTRPSRRWRRPRAGRAAPLDPLLPPPRQQGREGRASLARRRRHRLGRHPRRAESRPANPGRRPRNPLHPRRNRRHRQRQSEARFRPHRRGREEELKKDRLTIMADTNTETAPATTPQAPLSTIARIGEHDGQSVTLHAWLYNLRESGKLLFPIFRDGTGTIQGIVPKAAVPPEVFDTVKGLTQESSVVVTGKVRADKRAPGGYELDVENVEVVQRVPEDTPFPISLKEHGTDFLMEHRHLWVRTPRQSAILRIRAEIIKAARDFLDGNGFVLTDPPILTPAACEGTSTLFPVEYFGDEAYLTQSGQLYIESTALALGKVYSFGPTFRAEKSKTRRHLTEFWMIEPEVAYMDLDGDMQLAEEFLRHIVGRVLELHRVDLKTVGRDIPRLEAVFAGPGSFPRLTYDEAHVMLDDAYKAGKLEHPHIDGDDFGSPDETYISSQFDKPVMIHRYPAAIKAFYMQPDPADATKAMCVDVLAPEGYGEIIGGSQRIDSYELLKARIEDHGLPLAAFEWYLDLRRYGSVPHSGFGMGI